MKFQSEKLDGRLMYGFLEMSYSVGNQVKKGVVVIWKSFLGGGCVVVSCETMRPAVYTIILDWDVSCETVVLFAVTYY